MKIGVVLVTFNRLEKLKIALKKYDEQIKKPEYVLVVDNCSTDGTKDYLSSWKKIETNYKKNVIYLSSNTGGAGGFYTGMECALSLDADWIWLSDDDAYPRKDALLNINDYYENLAKSEKPEIVAMCATVYNKGKIHREHRNHLKVSKFKCTIYPSALEEYDNEAFRVDIFSYVGAVIRKDILHDVGLDVRDFFIYCDDQEHSLRIGRKGKMLCLTNSIVDHDTPPFDKKSVNWGRYYKKRNDLLMIRKNFPTRYFWLRYFRRYIDDVSILSKNSPELKKVLKAAYHDARINKMGIHSIYRPGWSAK